MFKNKSPVIPFRKLDTSMLSKAKYSNSNNITSLNTRLSLINTANSYNRYLTDNNLKLSPDSIVNYLSQQKLQQAPATWNLTRQNLKTAFKLQPGIRDNYPMKMLIEEIFREIKPFKINAKIDEYLTYKEIKKLIRKSDKKIGLIIKFLFITGCRISEMINIRLSDIKEKESIAIRIVGKGNKQRYVYIDYNLYNDIKNEFNSSYWLFLTSKGIRYNRSTIWRQIKRLGLRVLAREIHPHILRHSTANYLLLEKGKSPKYVSQYLGHSSPAVTLDMYIHDYPKEDILNLF